MLDSSLPTLPSFPVSGMQVIAERDTFLFDIKEGGSAAKFDRFWMLSGPIRFPFILKLVINGLMFVMKLFAQFRAEQFIDYVLEFKPYSFVPSNNIEQRMNVIFVGLNRRGRVDTFPAEGGLRQPGHISAVNQLKSIETFISVEDYRFGKHKFIADSDHDASSIDYAKRGLLAPSELDFSLDPTSKNGYGIIANDLCLLFAVKVGEGSSSVVDCVDKMVGGVFGAISQNA